jgi:hypothetical protein
VLGALADEQDENDVFELDLGSLSGWFNDPLNARDGEDMDGGEPRA